MPDKWAQYIVSNPGASATGAPADKWAQYIVPAPGAQAQQPSLAAGPDNTEGTYAMWNGQGQKVQVPYSNVGKARSQGFQFDTNPGPGGLTPQAQYQRDLGADPTIDKFQRQPSYLEELEATFRHPFNSLESASQPVMRPRNATMGEMVGADLHNVGAGAASVLRHPLRTAVGGVVGGLESVGGALTMPVEDAMGKENELQQIYDQMVKNGPQLGAYSIGQGLATAGLAKGLPDALYAAPGKAVGAAVRGAGNVLRFGGSTPQGRAVALTRALVPDPADSMLTRALKPSVVNEDFPGQITRTLPKIAERNPAPGVRGFADAAKAAQGIQQSWYESLLGPNRGRPASFKPAFGAQLRSVPTIAKIEDPTLMDRTAETAARFLPQKGVPGPQRNLGLADTLRKESNQRLASLYAKTGGSKYESLADPRVAREEALARSLRDITYGGLSDATGVPEGEIRARQSLYGDLGEVANIAQKRATVFGRQNPVSLQESIAMSGGNPVTGAAGWAAQRGLRNLTNSDALVDAAIDRYRSPDSATMPARDSLFGRGIGHAGDVVRDAGKGIPEVWNYRGGQGMGSRLRRSNVPLVPLALGASRGLFQAPFGARSPLIPPGR